MQKEIAIESGVKGIHPAIKMAMRSQSITKRTKWTASCFNGSYPMQQNRK